MEWCGCLRFISELHATHDTRWVYLWAGQGVVLSWLLRWCAHVVPRMLFSTSNLCGSLSAFAVH
jgi:hypothetical protein